MVDREVTRLAEVTCAAQRLAQIRGITRLVAICAFIDAASMLRAAAPADVDPAFSLSGVRQIFVPADRPDAWPTHDEAFLPVDPNQLRELLRQARASDIKTQASTEHAVEAVYYAQYVVNRLIDGRGCVVVVAAPEQPVLLEWPSSGAMIRNPRWKDRELEPVKIGTWGTNDSLHSRSGLLVNQSGSLLFSFQTAATAQTDDSTQFSVASPRALRRRLYLDLPGPYELASEDGSVTLLTDPIQAVTGQQGALMELPPLGIGYRRWQLTSGPGGTVRFRVKQPPQSDGVRNDASPYREQLTYSLQPHGMTLIAEFQSLEGHQLPPEVTVEFDPRLKLVGAQWQGAAINWQEQTIGSSGTARVRIAIPEARDRQPQLRIEAWGSLPPGELSPLPQISLPDLFWSEGILGIEVAEELDLLDLRASGLSPLSSTRPNQTNPSPMWQFAKLRPQATAEVALRDSENRMDAAIGTSLELSSASTKAIIRMQLRTSGQSLPPRLEAEVLGGWVIDSVESSSAVGFTDWYVDRIDGRRMLRVQFREPGDETYPAEVVIEAHLPKSAAVESIALADLMPVDWQSLAPERHILAVTVIEPLDLAITGKVDRLSFDVLTEQDWELLQNSDVAALLLMNQADLRTRLQLLPERPTFEAEAEVAVLVERQVVRQEVSVQIKPLRSPMSKLRVLLCPAPSSEISWVDPQTGAQLPAVRLTPAAQDSGANQIWEVQLSRGASGRQSLLARWSQEPRGRIPVPLIAMPEAVKQTATVRIVGKPHGNFDVIPTGLVRHALATTAPSGEPVSDAILRYDPAEMARNPAACQLSIDPSARGDMRPQTVVERVEIASQYSLRGESTHRADFELNGACPVRCWLPDGARQVRVAWDGQMVPHTLQTNELKLNAPASPAASTGVLQIDFTLPQEPLHDGTSLEAPLPNLGLPLPFGRWSVQLPNSFQLATSEYLRAIEPGWRGRLLGPWAGENSDSDVTEKSGASPSVAGWQTWEFRFAGSVPNPVSVIEFNQRWALAYGLGLAVACLTTWQLVRRPRLVVVLLGIAGIAALWLPPISSMFATTVWLGMVFGLVWRAVSAALGQARVAADLRSSKSGLVPATAMSLIILLFCASPQLDAQALPEDASAAPGAEASRAAEVLIPVDSGGAPTGEQYLVPADFLAELLRVSQQNRAERGGDWVIQRGRYQGELRQDATGGEAFASNWNLSWEVDVQRRNASVHFPLVKEQGKWQSAASVDGIPTPVQWRSDGRGCELLVREPGPHRVTLRVEPLVHVDGPRATLQLDLPPVLDAELQFVYPNGLKGLELPDSTIPSAADSQRSKVVFALSDSQRLDLSWRLNAQAAPAAAAWEVEQLELMSISPNGTELEVRLLLRGPGTPPAEVTVAVQRQLEPLDTHASVPREDALTDARTIVTAPVISQPASPDTGQASATLSFRLPRNQVFGNYRFPQVQVLDLVTRSKVAAVSLSDGFSYETIQSPVGETMETSDFAELWGDSRSTYDAAYRILGDQTPWTMAVQPRVATLPPDESLLVSCGLDELEVEFQAHFPPGGAPLVQQMLHVPPQALVRSVKLERSATTESITWTRPAPDRIVAFFPEPLAGDFRLALSSTVPKQPDGPTRIPTITARPGENLQQHVQIHRRPECLVQIRGPARNRSDSELARFDPWGAEAYLVEVFRDRLDRTARLSLDVRKNPAVSAAQSLTVFDPAVGVAFVSRIRVEQGILDRMDLEVPADWIGPLDISPPAQVVEQGDAAQGRRRMQIQLMNPVPAGQEIELRFNGSIAAPNDGSWIVPVLRLLGPNSEATFVAVPSKEAPAANSWTLQGAVPAELPPALLQRSKLPLRARVFRILPSRAQDYVVRRSPATQEHPLASFALADVYVREDESGSQVHAAQFLLPPIPSRELMVQWPEGHEPMAVYVENRLLTPLPADGHRWRLPIGPTDLPVALTMVSRSEAGTNRSLHLHRPRLWDHETEYPIPVTLWAVEAPNSRRPLAGAPDSAATGAEVALLRLARLTQLVTAAESRLASLSAPDRSAWTQLWSARLRSENAALERYDRLPEMRVDQSMVGKDDLGTRQQLIAQLNQLLARLAEPEVTVNPPTATGETGSVPPISAAARIDEGQRSNFIVGGPQSSLELQSSSSGPAAPLPQAAITIFLLATVGLLLRRTTSIDVARLLANHPRWLVGALGITSWLFLALPTVGGALLLAAFVSWAGDRWMRRASTGGLAALPPTSSGTKK